MTIVDEILAKSPSVRRHKVQWCDCGSDRSLVTAIYIDAAGNGYLYIPPQPRLDAATGAAEGTPPMAVALDGEEFGTVAECRRCRCGYWVRTTSQRAVSFVKLASPTRGAISP